MTLFITFEGGEGCGKSTQSKTLHKSLTQRGIPALLTHEPGGTPLSKKIRQLLKHDNDTRISPLAELLLFNAARAQLIAEVIRPALDKGEVVICDRYADSTTAYQGYGRGLDMETVKTINDNATQGLKPDLTILLDIAAEDGLARKKQRDRFEQEDIAFHHRVREGYLKLAKGKPRHWLVIDATQTRDEISEAIQQRVSELLSQRGD